MPIETINLTNRKTPPPKILGMFEKKAGENYKAKFSEAYQPAGHDFTRSFKVLKIAYWLKYGLLTPDDIFVYELLQLTGELEQAFSLEVLAEKLGKGDATLRQCLDNLENADLLEIYKTDGRGSPNFYLLRTPYFERDSIQLTGDDNHDRSITNRHKRIYEAGGELPATYLENELPRLRRQLETNRAKRLRSLARKKFSKSTLFKRFIRTIEEKKISWFKMVKRVGDNRRAATVENIIYGLAKSIPATDTNFEIFSQRFKESCEAAGIEYSRELLEDAKQLVAFYDRHRKPATPTDQKTAAKDSIRQYLKLNKSISPVLFANFLNEKLNVLTFAEIQDFVSGDFTPQNWQVIVNEMRC